MAVNLRKKNYLNVPKRVVFQLNGYVITIENLSFRLVLYVICFLLGNSPASDAGELPKRKHITIAVLLNGATCRNIINTSPSG